jgi:uncharacterized membrane protein
MTESGKPKRLLYVTYISLAVNIFMFGYFAAQHNNSNALLPQTPAEYAAPLPAMDGTAQSPVKPPRVSVPPFMQKGLPSGSMPAIPLSTFPFVAGDLLSDEELDADTELHKLFEKMQGERRELAVRLKQEGISAEVMTNYFDEIDKSMDEIKAHLQQKIINKINSLTPEERKHFADELLEE